MSAKNDIKIEDALSPDKLHLIFKELECASTDALCEAHYILKKKGCLYGEILYLGLGEWRFIKDNFPAPRRIYSTNFPFESFLDFNESIERIGFKMKIENR